MKKLLDGIDWYKMPLSQPVSLLRLGYYQQGYWDQEGLFVFSTLSHIRRGQCCGKGCLRCPYFLSPRRKRS